MAKNKRFEKVCTICRKNYQFCSQCSDFDHLPRWMDAYCSENCKDLYNIAAGWINNWLDKDVELARLEKIDLSRKEYYPDWLKNVIDEMNSSKSDVPLKAIVDVLEKDDEKKDDEKKVVSNPVDEISTKTDKPKVEEKKPDNKRNLSKPMDEKMGEKKSDKNADSFKNSFKK